jgi:exopolysaccharide production protein ExoQ
MAIPRRGAWPDWVAAVLPLTVGIYAALSTQMLLIHVLVGGALALAHGFAVGTFAGRRFLAFAAALALLFAWAAASALWSLDARTTLAWIGTDAAIAAGGLVLLACAFGINERKRAWSRRGTLWGWAIAWLALTAQYATGTPFLLLGDSMPVEASNWRSALNNQAVFVGLLGWAAGLALAPRGRWLVLVPPLASLATLTQSNSAAAQIALVAGILAFALGQWRARPVALAMVAGLAVLFAALPSLVRHVDGGAVARALPQSVEFSAFHRFEIWRFTAERIAERPLLGWGARVAGRIPGADATIDFASERATKLRRQYSGTATRLSKHPHNGALQARLDLGLIGAAVAFTAMAAALLALPRAGPAAPTALAVAAMALVVSQLSYDLWQDWWHAALWLTASLLAAAGRPAAWIAPDAAV